MHLSQIISGSSSHSLGEVARLVHLVRDRGKIWLNQHSHVDKFTHQLQCEQLKATYTPLVAIPESNNGVHASPCQVKYYKKCIGSLLYLATVARADISFAVKVLPTHTLNPSLEYVQAARRLMSYCHTTKFLSVCYDGNVSRSSVVTHTPQTFESASDAAFADDTATRKSSEGYLFKLFGGPIMGSAFIQNHQRSSTVTTCKRST